MFEKFKIKKRGEVTTPELIFWIVLIASFAVIIFFLLRLNLKGNSVSDICRNSVELRGNPISSELVPLNCKTRYFCVSKDGSCENMNKPEIKKAKTKDDVYKILAEQMAECWWMFGEGKIEYIDKERDKDNYCSICSQLGFDDSIKEIAEFKDGILNKDELYNYLTSHERTSKAINYSEYFFGTNDINKVKQLISEQNENTELSFGTLDLNKQQYVMMGITSEVSTVKWILDMDVLAVVAIVGKTVAVAVGVATPPGWIASALIAGLPLLVGTGVSKLSDINEPEISAIVVKGDGIDNSFMAPTIIEADYDKFKALGCEDIKTLS